MASRHALKMVRAVEQQSFSSQLRNSLPYILTGAIIILGALIIYFILAPGTSPPQSSTTSSGSGTSIYGAPAPLTPTPSPSAILPATGWPTG